MPFHNNPIKFITNSKYRHVLYEDFSIDLKHSFKDDFEFLDFIKLSRSGVLELSTGYAWDGVSVPGVNIDSCKNLRAAIVHDALYQLMRNIPAFKSPSNLRFADKVFRELLIQDGVKRSTAWLFWGAVHVAGDAGARPEDRLEKGQSPCP